MHFNFKDIKGQRFGKLVAIRMYEKDTQAKYYWECQCDCGKTHHTSGHALRLGRSNSCGCETGRKKHHDREAVMMKDLYHHSIKKRSKAVGFQTYITLEEFKEVIVQSCYYCGIPHSKKIEDVRYEKGNKHYITDTVIHCNGVDRLDSSKGYIEGNIESCCTICNRAKLTMSKDEFISWIKRLYKVQIKK